MTSPDSAPPRIRPENIKILCVDSDEASLEVLERVFKFRAYNTTLRKNGQDALIELGQNTYDIILCDLKLSDMSGIDVLEQFKNKSPDTIRMLTSSASEPLETSTAINKGGIYRLIPKPSN